MIKDHWEKVYKKKALDSLGWYETLPEPSLELIECCNLNREASILNVGAGATTLVDVLLQKGFKNIQVNDISITALEELKKRLGTELSEKVHWVVDDLCNPGPMLSLDPVDLWHDRAVLHFFNHKDEQESYFNLLRQLVKEGGYAIIAAFNLNGAKQCSGLPVFRYNQHMLQEQLGPNFSLIKSFDYTDHTPSGNPREYVYTLFQRNSA